MENQKFNKTEKNKMIRNKEYFNKFSSFILKPRNNLYKINNIIKNQRKIVLVNINRKKIFNSESPLNSNILLKSSNNNSQSGLSPQDSNYLGPLDKNKKSLRSNDIKSYLSNTIVYQPKDTKYKLIISHFYK